MDRAPPTPTSSSTTPQKLIKLHNKRPDSMKLELLTIPENGYIQSFPASPASGGSIGFKDLSYSVREGLIRRRNRMILRNVNGEFGAGELAAIMGPSGAGKSSLMNILAGYTKSGVTGTLMVNEERRNEDLFRKQSCYIMQDDNLQPLLTVHEAMMVAANLKLSSSYNSKEKTERVKEILESISLWENRTVKTMSLSGGQKKRLSIALELLKNPQFLFFDEPTSGLDSSTSKQCVMLLKEIAATGRTVVCTIHQPSAMLFEMFDHLYAVAEGQCIYQGCIKGLVPYLGEAGLHCPSYHNPADFLLEVASGEFGNYTEILVQHSNNGLNTDWKKTQRNMWQLHSLEHVDKMMQSGRITPVRAPPVIFPRVAKRTMRRESEIRCCERQYPTSFCNQLFVLLKRNFLIILRDRTLTYSRLITHICIGFFIGILYYDIGGDASNILNNFNYLFFSVIFLQFTAFNSVTTTFPSELPIVTREHFNRWYSLISYYLAVTFADIPVQVIATLIYALLTYFLTMQPVEGFRLAFFLIICILVSLVAQSFGLFIGASMSVKNGVIFGPLLVLPFTIFSGFFVQLYDAHPYLQWLFHISYLKYAFEGAVLAVFGYDRGKLPCEKEDYCHFVHSDRFLEEMDMKHSQYYVAVLALIAINIFIRICAFLALHIQINRKK